MTVHDETLALAKDLIARRSVTPDDAGCTAVIAARLSAIGFTCERLDRGDVTNLWARRGTSRPLVCIAGHTDVVPSGPVEQWASDPFTPSERAGRLYGRGASDMKGPLAAGITAIERLVARRPEAPGSIGVLLTSDEEGDARDGTAAVVDALAGRAESIDQCLLVEATSSERLGDGLKNGRRGSLSGTLTVHGVQGHVAYPHLARNPIHLVAPALAELVAVEWDRGDEYFPPTTFQISNVHGGTGATNVIPGTLMVAWNFRFSPASTVDQLTSRVREILDRHRVEYDLSWTLSGSPFFTPPGPLTTVVSAVVREVTGIEPALSTGGGISDARFIRTLAREVVEFGPVNDSIHKADEHIRLADLEPLSRIYEQVLERLLDGRF